MKCRGCVCSLHCNMHTFYPRHPTKLAVSCVDGRWKVKSKRLCVGKKQLRKLCITPKSKLRGLKSQSPNDDSYVLKESCPYNVTELVSTFEAEAIYVRSTPAVIGNQTSSFNWSSWIRNSTLFSSVQRCSKKAICRKKHTTSMYEHPCSSFKGCRMRCINYRYFLRKCTRAN